MIFPYQCSKCEKKFELEFPIGKAPRETECTSCHSSAKRIYEGTCIAVKIDGAFHRTSKFGEQMKARNIKAGERSKGKKPGLRLAGYQYADGRVEEAHK